MANQQVPLVIYKNGQRIVLGRASVSDSGAVEAQISKDYVHEFRDAGINKLLVEMALMLPYSVAAAPASVYTPKSVNVTTESESP